MIGTNRVNLAHSNWSYANAGGAKVDGVIKFIVTTEDGKKHLCIICLQTKQHKEKEEVKALESDKVEEEYGKFLLFKEAAEKKREMGERKKAKKEKETKKEVKEEGRKIERSYR